MAKKKRSNTKARKKRRRRIVRAPPEGLPAPHVTVNPERPTTARDIEFAHEYVRDWNATRAARAIGCNRETAGSDGWYMLRKPKVQRLIVKLRKQKRLRAKKLDDKVMREITRVAMSDMRELGTWGRVAPTKRDEDDGRKTGEERNLAYFVPFDSDAITDDAAAVVSELAIDDKGRVKLKTHSKMQALHELVKLLDMYGRVGGEEAKEGEHEVVLTDETAED